MQKIELAGNLSFEVKHCVSNNGQYVAIRTGTKTGLYDVKEDNLAWLPEHEESEMLTFSSQANYLGVSTNQAKRYISAYNTTSQKRVFRHYFDSKIITFQLTDSLGLVLLNAHNELQIWQYNIEKQQLEKVEQQAFPMLNISHCNLKVAGDCSWVFINNYETVNKLNKKARGAMILKFDAYNIKEVWKKESSLPNYQFIFPVLDHRAGVIYKNKLKVYDQNFQEIFGEYLLPGSVLSISDNGQYAICLKQAKDENLRKQATLVSLDLYNNIIHEGTELTYNSFSVGVHIQATVNQKGQITIGFISDYEGSQWLKRKYSLHYFNADFSLKSKKEFAIVR